MHAVLSFIETSFAAIDGSAFNLEFFPTAKAHGDAGQFVPTASDKYLSQKDVSIILDYSLAVSVMRNASEAEINDVFDRINTYGHRLSDQERRQAGVTNDFSTMVRETACNLRGDVSSDVLPLYLMQSISIDLPMSRHGYEVKSEEVFWVNQGVLRSTDLRDSMDEQCIADIAACVVGNNLIERSKEALDDIYTQDSAEANRVLAALKIYGATKFSAELNFCVQEILKVCAGGKQEKLRDIIFERRTTNPFPSVFAVLIMAFHELIVRDEMKIADYAGAKTALTNLSARIDTSRRATSPDERRKNIDTIKGLVHGAFVKGKAPDIYGGHTTVDIESIIRRSEIELPTYELKQALLRLTPDAEVDEGVVDKVVKTACAMANIGPNSSGKILIGVTDRSEHAYRVKELYGIDAKQIGHRYVVGVNREAEKLKCSTEEYFGMWKSYIGKSALSDGVKADVLSNIDFNSFFGYGLITITIPHQKALSFVGDEIYWRNGDSTELASTPKQIANLAQRF